MIKEGEPRLLMESVFLGVVGALSARVFMWMLHLSEHIFLYLIAGYTPPGSTALRQTIGPHGLWLIPIATTVGGLISGALVYGFAPEAEGHGTDTVVTAFHRAEGFVRPRVPLIKLVASAITIGSGGAAGREGPIALITAGLGSVYATFTHHTNEERRLLLLAGMAAGLAAIFRTPMGTGVFAIEVLYGNMEFEVNALLYTMASSAVAYTVNGLFVGWAPLFSVPVSRAPGISSYIWYVVLGLASGLLATLLPVVFYRTRDLFHELPVPQWTKPAIGGLGVGLLALKFPQILAGGYGWIQEAMNNHLALGLLLFLAFAKLIAFALTVSSGGSGGVFAPSLFIGAMLGGAFAQLFHQPSAVFVVVGMAAVFGAAAHVPVATMLMVTEMAGGYHLLVPSGLAVMVSYLLQTRLSASLKYSSLYEGQVPTRADSPAHYLENIDVALRLLSSGNIQSADKFGNVDLLRLMRSGARFVFPGKKEFYTGVLKEDSPIVGGTIGTLYDERPQHDFEVIAIVRGEQVLLVRRKTVLEAGDRLILIASPDARAALTRHLAAVRPATENPMRERAA